MADTDTESETDTGASGGGQPGPFVFNKRPSVWWPIDIGVPADGGEIVHHRVQVRLPYLTAEQLDDGDAAARELDAGEWGGDDDPLVDWVLDWDGVAQETPDGRQEPVPCEGEAKRNFVAHEAVRQPLWRALTEICLSQEASAKNSAPPPEPGRTAAAGRGKGKGKTPGRKRPARSNSN